MTSREARDADGNRGLDRMEPVDGRTYVEVGYHLRAGLQPPGCSEAG